MRETKAFKTLIFVTFGAGALSFCLALIEFGSINIGLSGSLILLSALFVTSRLTISLPRSTSHLSFSDSMIFFAFIFYGGPLAIMIAITEQVISCAYLRWNGVRFQNFAFSFNVAVVASVTTMTYLVYLIFQSFGLTGNVASTPGLISTMMLLGSVQFVGLTSFSAAYYSLKKNESFLQIWKKVGPSVSITQIAGAGLAIIVYKLVLYADILTFGFAIVVFGLAYINYRQMFRDINDSILQAEQADMEKTEIAKLKIEEAEEHTHELEVLLKKEEKISNDLRQSKHDLEHAAFHDALTDLPNRAYLIERLDLLLKLGIKVSKNYYVLFLDLSRFKNINDSLGHTIGDEVLKVVALRLRRTLRDEDTAARLGGDEFAIVLNDISSLEDAKGFAYEVHRKLSQPYTIQGNTIYSDLHIGIAPFDIEQIKPEDVLRDADIAMQNAKENNVGVAVFDKEVRSEYLEHIRLEGDLRYACERGEFSMHYQPLISLRTGELFGFEALLRWQHPELGFISPDRFIPISEDSGAIIPITNWILKQTTNRIAEWQSISNDYKDILVSVNISGRHLADHRLISDVRNALKESGLSPKCLKLEITETTAMENAERTIEILQQLKALGVHISIDDFGTGYSSLSYLHRLPFDTLKIDRSFVINVSERNKDTEILETIIALTKNLKKEVIAEGIETVEQLEILTDFGCDYGQGYLFSRPLPVAEMETELYKKKDWLPHDEDEDDGVTVPLEPHVSLF